METRQVLGFEKYVVTEDGNVVGAKGNILNPWVGRGGYLKVCISKGDRKTRRWVYVHRLVCECFHGNPIDGQEVNHKDGNKFHNSASNLEWVTRSENNIHAFRIGLRSGLPGEQHSYHRLIDEDIHKIRALRGLKTQKEIGEMFGVSGGHISAVQLHKNWVHLVEVQHV